MVASCAWITGAGGLIGSHIARAAPVGWQGRGLTRADFDLTDFSAVREAFRRDHPELVIHCAAMSRTPACEANPEAARKNNVDVTRMLCELAEEIPLIFFSTDLVFDGRKGDYNENDDPNPLTVYGETKAAGEHTVLSNSRHTVIRTSLNAGATPRGNGSFNEQLRALWASGERTRLFRDEFRSPMAAGVTARAVWELFAANRPGLYHLAGAERLSRFDIGRLIAARWPQLNPQIEPASLRDYAGPRRSPDTSLDSGKIQGLLSFPLPGFSDWLRANPQAEI